MQLEKLDHVALVSADAGRCRDWYCRILGMEWVFQGQWDNNPYFLAKAGAYLAIFQARTPSSPAPRSVPRLDHFAFRAKTREDFEDIRAELADKEVPFEEEDHGISRSLYIRDPDGNTVEITTYAV